MKKISIQKNNRVFIIAEAGVNHNGSLDTAKKLVDVAAAAHADAVKFQTFKAESLVIPNLKKAKYQIDNTRTGESQFSMLKRLELPLSAFRQLYNYCAKKNIIFMSTPFDEESVDFLDSIGMKIFKIPSSEIINKPLIQYIALKKKPIILSTGMSYLKEVRNALAWIEEIHREIKQDSEIILLHCVSCYPASFEEVNLLAIKTLKSSFNLPVGFSDHTQGIEASVASVAMGAKVIEKHFTLNKNMDGPDHKASLEPNELKALVKAIRNVESSLGDGVKRPSPSEQMNRLIVRKSIVAKRDIKKGEKFTEENITVKRPGFGISPMKWEKVIGKIAKRDFKEDETIKI